MRPTYLIRYDARMETTPTTHLDSDLVRECFGAPVRIVAKAAKSWTFCLGHDGASFYRRSNGETVAVIEATR